MTQKAFERIIAELKRVVAEDSEMKKETIIIRLTDGIFYATTYFDFLTDEFDDGLAIVCPLDNVATGGMVAFGIDAIVSIEY